jgi:hypothetical protein
VPSGFFIMDSLLVLDYFLMDKMLLPEGKATCDRETKVELARQETNKMKRLLGALRYLWRNGFLNTRAKDMGFLCFFLLAKWLHIAIPSNFMFQSAAEHVMRSRISRRARSNLEVLPQAQSKCPCFFLLALEMCIVSVSKSDFHVEYFVSNRIQ